MGTKSRLVRRALWDAINEYTESCGGHGGMISTRRMKAVVAVEQAVDAEVATLRDRVTELERERDAALTEPSQPLPEGWEVQGPEDTIHSWSLIWRGLCVAKVKGGSVVARDNIATPAAALRALLDAAGR